MYFYFYSNKMKKVIAIETRPPDMAVSKNRNDESDHAAGVQK